MTHTDYQKQVFMKEHIWETAQSKSGERQRAEIIRDLLPPQITSVLDAGCGSGVVANILGGKLVVGLDRSSTALAYVQSLKLEGDLTTLPFTSHQFEATVCSEVLEHIPYPLYGVVLSELTRVTRKYMVISVPWKQVIRNAQIECPACKCRFQPHYHMRTFNELNMEELFQMHGFNLSRLTTAGQKTPLLGINSVLAWFNLRQFPSFTVCPQCGYERPTVVGQKNPVKEARSGAPSSDNSANRKKAIGKMARRYWPRLKTRPRWWVAMYERA